MRGNQEQILKFGTKVIVNDPKLYSHKDRGKVKTIASITSSGIQYIVELESGIESLYYKSQLKKRR
ncbi:hypothetical protein M5W68_15575 [Paenibacillus larvae]|uniref:hypothetical protein n=1 Tax=Paenibacillus larvae TaxID=1464 RepID=UPI00227FF9D6|nr:hypothetical protein [Paenibacillus larvae]MCY9511935.1 hypothetical protein [Paenibacillus larvae]MCY9526495.1 hypothetical protein [Paenibacillus larvae]